MCLKISCIAIFILTFVMNTNGQNLKSKVDNYFEYNNFSPQLNGYLGGKLNMAINGVKARNIMEIVEPFKHKEETWMWQTEFWGKWITSAILAYSYGKDPELLAIIDKAYNALVATQTPDGYIGNYRYDKHLEQWDIWGRKYVMLGLIAYYDMNPLKNKKAIEVTQKEADYLIKEINQQGKSIVQLGNYRGLASGSVLEPIVLIYERTGLKKYLDFAMSIVNSWENAEESQLITKALNGVPVAERIPLKPGQPWNLSGQKSYEMMSCYEGLLELYQVTGNKDYLKATELTAQNIIDDEINIIGTGSASECWFHGREKQMEDIINANEICVTTTWIKLCNRLFLLTGNPKYLEQIEKSMYNALIAGLTPDSKTYVKYPSMQGVRMYSGGQCGMELNCCGANGTRAFALYPKLMYTKNDEALFVNLYEQSTDSFYTESGNKVQIQQNTCFPKGDSVVIVVNPEKSENFTIALRMPSWGGVTQLCVNGFDYETYGGLEYQKITRNWEKGDRIFLKFDMKAQIHKLKNYFAITKGPIVLGRDARFKDGFVYEPALLPKLNDSSIELQENKNITANMFLSLTVNLSMGVSSDVFHTQPRTISLCDFGSAGNTWDENSLFKVWFEEPLDITEITRVKD